MAAAVALTLLPPREPEDEDEDEAVAEDNLAEDDDEAEDDAEEDDADALALLLPPLLAALGLALAFVGPAAATFSSVLLLKSKPVSVEPDLGAANSSSEASSALAWSGSCHSRTRRQRFMISFFILPFLRMFKILLRTQRSGIIFKIKLTSPQKTAVDSTCASGSS